MTVTDYDYRSGRAKIMQRALRIVGALPLEDAMSAEQEAQASQALNEMLRRWQSQGVFLWEIKQLSFVTVAGTDHYTISTDPVIIDLEAAYIVNPTNWDQKLELIGWLKYNDIPDKAASGLPTHLAVQRTTGNPVAYVWPVPDAVYTIKVLAVARLKDYDTSASTPDFPVDFEEAMVYGLADALYDEYPATLGQRERISTKALAYFKEARSICMESSDEDVVEGAFSYRRCD